MNYFFNRLFLSLLNPITTNIVIILEIILIAILDYNDYKFPKNSYLIAIAITIWHWAAVFYTKKKKYG